ncbi:unnamed protein product [Spirodela intermedia]|uniref:Homeobox domain-containing protein n=1 Tax=Spirodela intermedia TaxID=51605 RepID=A0A7I8K4D9_SPIIN|nr:unnamed protein product [Spirodela intermedia]
MEPQSYQQPQEDTSGGAVGSGAGGGSKSSFLCRQSSSRWIPTTDQIRILRDLYYNCGVRSPSAEQIQRISARLRQFGKIEGKNVFYWFQNHKARERQKKRLTVDVTSNKYNSPSSVISPGVPTACTSPGLYFGQVSGNGCGGSPSMERSYMEYAIPGGLAGGSTVEGGVGWMGVEPPAVPPMYYHHQRSSYYYEQEHHHHRAQQQRGGEAAPPPPPPHIETLPLFPVRSEEDILGSGYIPIRAHFSAAYLDQPQSEEEEDRRHYRVYGGDGASLELSLYSFDPLPTTSS